VNNWKNWSQRWKIKYAQWLLHSLSRTSMWSDKVSQRFSRLGMGLMVALLVTIIFGSNLKISMLYQLFTILFAMLLLAIAFNIVQGKRLKKEVHLARHLPSFATVGEPFVYRISIQNKSNHDLFKLRIDERWQRKSPSLVQFLHQAEPDEEKRNWYDRKVGYYRFIWHQKQLRGYDAKSNDVNILQAAAQQDLTVEATPLRRGYIHFSALRVRYPELLGLLYHYQDEDLGQSLLVLPKRYQIPQTLQLTARRMFQQGGVAMASHVGEAEEFNRLREYRAGDSPRKVHWPSLARGHKLLVKAYQDEHFTRQALIVDHFADESLSLAMEEAISLAAGFVAQTQNEDSLLDLMFVGERNHVETVTQGRSLAYEAQMLEALATLQACPEDDFSVLEKVVLQHADAFASCVLILLHWDEIRRQLVQQLTMADKSVCVFLVVDEQHTMDDQEITLIRQMTDQCFVLRTEHMQQDLNDLKFNDTGQPSAA